MIGVSLYWAGDCAVLVLVLTAFGINAGLGGAAIVLDRVVSLGLQTAAARSPSHFSCGLSGPARVGPLR